MSDVKLVDALDNLGIHLYKNTSANLSSRMTLSQTKQEQNAPYIGIVNNSEDVLVRDPYSERLSITIELYLVVREENIGLEEFKQEVKDALRTASLGDNVQAIEYEGAAITVIEDFKQADAEKYSGVVLTLSIMFMDNHTTVPLFATGSSIGPILEPVGFAHYKTYALLASGSIATNTYYYHDVANLELDGITVGVVNNQDSEDARSVTSLQKQFINHQVELSVRYHNAYDPGSVDHVAVIRNMDLIVDKLKSNFNLGDQYKMMEFSSIAYNETFPESQTMGGQVNVRIDKLVRYSQD